MALTLDLDLYLRELEDWDAPEEQKIEFIIAIWGIMFSVAQIGFEIHPAQMAAQKGRKPSKKSAETQDKPGIAAEDMLYSDHIQRTRIIRTSKAENAAGVNDSTI